MKKLLLILFPLFIHAGLLPDYDKRVDRMSCCKAELPSTRYFKDSVPHNIFQIWFGNPSKRPKEKTDQWKAYAKEFDYHYVLVSEGDLHGMEDFIYPPNMDWIRFFIQSGHYHSASDIVRMELLNHMGGVYVDADFLPPSKDGVFIDLEDLFSFQGLTVVVEHKGRNVGESALFACNGILIACPEHPVIRSMTLQFDQNIQCWHKNQKNYDAMFISGPFLFNKVLNGTYGVSTMKYLKEFGMVD